MVQGERIWDCRCKAYIVMAATFGAALRACISDRRGRTSIRLCIASSLVITFPLNLPMIYISTKLIGLGLGITSVSIPLYIL